MGKVLMRAGGGRVSTENLTANNIKSGVTVSVKQGSKPVQSVTGSLKVKRINIPSANGNVDMKTILPDAWQQLTIENFAYSVCSSYTRTELGSGQFERRTFTASTSLAYDQSTGILTISGTTDRQETASAAHAFYWGNTRSVVCYYCE